uniref:NADH-ubiquinone oxidoreductase chain 5 n=1 Tax=Stichopus chloronotus TaxID=240144 RepID=A0A7U1ARK3_STICL|nr:NADH dehydrogenase subunit 5 [Stichopus chloronotus]QQY85605.1 NADH dehydrogenase subunit 5 [Stichopus chloronotus]
MTLSSIALNTSITLSIFIILILTSAFSNKNSNNTPSTRELSESHICLTSMKTLSILALTNLLLFTIGSNAPISSSLLPWINNTSINSIVSINIDSNFMFFSTVALLVTWSIMEFSIYYMHSDPFSSNFFRLLVIFLLNMLILTAAENLFLFFVGWEGVGFLSFLLISWWTTRTDANSSALQAIIYNRIGDLGIIVLLSVALFNLGSWNINNICHLNGESDQWWTSLILFAALIGAIGKSAQFGLHPWLPAAMEGPTPVSALLHSSTMVVAGVFLLIRITNILQPTPAFLNTTLIVGSLTAIFAATSAFHQHDIKKIIAYSTTSQLGLMMVSIGLNNPLVALFHICTHAFFKAMLFLCSGSIIHSFNNEQDLRKMNNISQSLPITASCLFLGSIALMGIPFLSGFYSKDLILELVIENPSNLFSFFLSSVATLLTAAYSFRIITFCFSNNPNSAPVNPINEEDQNLFFPLVRLAIGSIFIGWSMSLWILDLPTLFPLSIVKNIPTTVTIIGATMASTTILFLNTNTLSNSFFSKTWFFTSTLHSTIATTANLTAFSLSTRTLDRGWNETIGGQGIFLSNNEAIKKQQLTQTGYIKQYLLSITLLILITALTITIS